MYNIWSWRSNTLHSDSGIWSFPSIGVDDAFSTHSMKLKKSHRVPKLAFSFTTAARIEGAKRVNIRFTF